VFLISELFKEAAVISDGELVYVFPTENMPNTVFTWDAKVRDWSRWYAIIGYAMAFRMVLDPRGPYAKFGHVHEPWDVVANRPPAVRLPPSSFFILAYTASRGVEEFAEPKIVSISDFDYDKVRELAKRLKRMQRATLTTKM